MLLSDEERRLPRDKLGRYEKYGITFIDIRPNDLEFLRTWRNHPDIRRYMVFQDEISHEAQLRWFAAIDPQKECYSVIVFHGERVGLTQVRNIDAASKTAEGGIIIFRPEDQNGLIPYRAAIGGMDWDFLERGLVKLNSTVRKDNVRAQRFVRSLGYRLSDPDSAGDILVGEVDAGSYFAAAKKWRQVLLSEGLR